MPLRNMYLFITVPKTKPNTSASELLEKLNTAVYSSMFEMHMVRNQDGALHSVSSVHRLVRLLQPY